MAQLNERPNEVRVFDGVPELMRATAEEIALAARQAVGDRGRFTWALAVAPLMPGTVSFTTRSTVAGSSMPIGSVS